MAGQGFDGLLANEALAGAKLALWSDDRLLCYQRDDFVHIPDPGCWDLPGGLREPGETIRDCALRELREEFGIGLPAEGFDFAARWVKYEPHRIEAVFLAARLPEHLIGRIVFGEEGQRWEMMPVADYVAHERGVRELQSCVALWWEGLGG